MFLDRWRFRQILAAFSQYMNFKTSLNMFKHFNLKRSFPIIKDNKTKDRAGVGDKPPLPNFCRSLFQFDTISFNCISKNQSESIWSKLIEFEPIWTNFIWFEANNQPDPSWPILIQFESIWSNLIWVDLSWTKLFKQMNKWVKKAHKH